DRLAAGGEEALAQPRAVAVIVQRLTRQPARLTVLQRCVLVVGCERRRQSLVFYNTWTCVNRASSRACSLPPPTILLGLVGIDGRHGQGRNRDAQVAAAA